MLRLAIEKSNSAEIEDRLLPRAQSKNAREQAAQEATVRGRPCLSLARRACAHAARCTDRSVCACAARASATVHVSLVAAASEAQGQSRMHGLLTAAPTCITCTHAIDQAAVKQLVNMDPEQEKKCSELLESFFRLDSAGACALPSRLHPAPSSQVLRVALIHADSCC